MKESSNAPGFHFKKQPSVSVLLKKIAHEILSKFTCNLIKTYKDFDIGEVDKIPKIKLFRRTPANGWFRILHTFICLTP